MYSCLGFMFCSFAFLQSLHNQVKRKSTEWETILPTYIWQKINIQTIWKTKKQSQKTKQPKTYFTKLARNLNRGFLNYEMEEWEASPCSSYMFVFLPVAYCSYYSGSVMYLEVWNANPSTLLFCWGVLFRSMGMLPVGYMTEENGQCLPPYIN